MSYKIAIVGTVGLPAIYGGFETLTHNLVRHLDPSYEIVVYCSSLSYQNKPETYLRARLKYVPLKANGIQSIIYDIVSLFSAIRTAETIIILGVSGCLVLPLLKQFSSCKFIVNIDGLEWQRDKWRMFARWFLKLSERQAVKWADEVVTDNKVIQDYVASEYSRSSQLIAYGGDQAKHIPISKEAIARHSFLHSSYAFGVCRIEPENNLHMILEAASLQSAVNVVIVGNWSSNIYSRHLRENYLDEGGIFLLDPIYDEEELNMLRSNCVLYLHGHSAGGTNPSLVEAMALGLRICAYDVAYNRETTEDKATYFSSAEDLVEMLMSANSVNIDSQGKDMYEVAERRYRWGKISDQYAALL